MRVIARTFIHKAACGGNSGAGGGYADEPSGRKLSRETAAKLLAESWERLGLSYDSYRRGLRLTLLGVKMSE